MASYIGSASVAVTITRADFKVLNGFLRSAPDVAPVMQRRKLILVFAFVALFVFGATGRLHWWAIGGLYVVLMIEIVVVRIVMKQIFELRRKSFDGHYSANAEGLTVTRERGRVRVDWSVITRSAISEQHLVMEAAPLSGYVIPLRCFTDPAEQQRFAAFVANASSAGITHCWPTPIQPPRG